MKHNLKIQDLWRSPVGWNGVAFQCARCDQSIFVNRFHLEAMFRGVWPLDGDGVGEFWAKKLKQWSVCRG